MSFKSLKIEDSEDSENNENTKSENNENNDITIELQLGDVIQISNPLNENIHSKIFFIEYLDKSKVYLLDTDSLEKIKIKISEEGVFGDGNIDRIAILSRSDTPSYAKQNGLVLHTWINIYFGGDYPVIITGEITNVEEDMIEIRTIERDTLYINFDYKGIPDDLPIENIEIRSAPPPLEKVESNRETPLEKVESNRETPLENQEDYEEEIKKDIFGEDTSEEIERHDSLPYVEKEQNETIVSPLFERAEQQVKNQLREFILRADQIKFGDEEFGPVVQYVDVSSKSQRYSLEEQVADLLDELLSTIPNSQRTNKVLNTIHIIINRFKQLREKFSLFDKYGNIEQALVKKSTYKPLIEYFHHFQKNLYWILPVVKNIKKVYDVNDLDEKNTDVQNILIKEDLDNLSHLMNSYKSNTLPVEQNKYSALYNELNTFFTPFELIHDEHTEGVLLEKNVETDIQVILDNLEDMYSSVFSNNSLRSKRFIIQKYNLGLTKLDTLESTNSRNTTIRVKMTNPDILSIQSFLTLPEPTIRFSKINLPGSSILDKANLNLIFLNYWQFLKKKTTLQNVLVDNLENEIEFNEYNFVNNVKHYVLNLSNDDLKSFTRDHIYTQFVDMIVPKTKILFNLMKKYIHGKLSIVDVVSYLEPFLIYTDDLTYQQYVDITTFIHEKISEHNKEFMERSRLFYQIHKHKSAALINTQAYSIFSIIENKYKEDLFEKYDILIDTYFKNSEVLRKIMLKDNGKLYTTALSLQSISLMFPNDISAILKEEKESKEKDMKEEEKKNTCKTMTIAKMYTSLQELQEDHDQPIYFDKKYDNTNYGLLESHYEKELIRMSPDELKTHMVQDLMKKKYSERDAHYLANTLLDGHKKVMDGQYALLYKGYNENTQEEVDYYVRQDNKWVLDKDIPDPIHTDESTILCNLQKNCVSVPDKIDDTCESMQVDKIGMQTHLLQKVMNEFDIQYKLSKQEFETEIQSTYEYLSDIMGVLNKIETNDMLKYNNQKYKLSINIEENLSVKPVSPSTTLLNLIFSQSDFVKKQYDLVKFVHAYTRPANTHSNEDIHWLYCLKTDVPLLPIFKLELASAFVTNPDGYMDHLNLLKSKIGKRSDDGDLWCDKYTGMPICPVDFDVEEGYEEGFKISTRAVLEDEAGNKIVSAIAEKITVYDSHESKGIHTIVNVLSVAMGIQLENQKPFILNSVLSCMKDTLESETDYKQKIKEMANKGKKIMSYTDFYNTALLYYTLGMFLIAVQTSIPSIKTRKTHPNCIRSFSGYPFEGTGDLSSLQYLVCVANDIRQSGEPWNVLKGKKLDMITNKLKSSIDSVLLFLPDVKRKMEEKTNYLLSNPANDIPEEHSVGKWIHFLPPLMSFKIRHLNTISDEFKQSLLHDLRTGSPNQKEKILVIDSKIIQFSLAIQERIQEIVKKEKLILHNSNNEPYLENSCCEGKEGETTIDYFMNQDNKIREYNVIVHKLTDLSEDINTHYSKSGLFYSAINTKNKYPSIHTTFDEKNIFLSFIHFCKFRSLIPIPVELIPLCVDKPDISLIHPEDSIERIIQKLKENGRQYTNEQFLRLLQLIARQNRVDISFPPEVSSITRLLHLIDSMEDQQDNTVEDTFRTRIRNALDTFDIASNEPTREVRELNNFLIKEIKSMKQELIEFIQTNTGSNITKSSVKKTIDTMKYLDKWVSDDSTHREDMRISDERMYTIVQFYKTFVENFAMTFPNIILNKVDYTDVLIPSYFKFSSNHVKKLKKSMSEYYEKLKTFYGVSLIGNILQKIQKITKHIVALSKNTPCFTSIQLITGMVVPVFDERTSKFVYEYYLLKILLQFIELSEDPSMLVTEVVRQTEVNDLFTVEYLEEEETKTDISIATRTQSDSRLLAGSMKECRQKITELLIAFLGILQHHKDTIDISYEVIQDRVFKLREKEKNMVTDRLKKITDEERDVDTILKITKLGPYSKALQKGLTTLDKDFYDEEREFRDQMEKTERSIRKKNKDANDATMDILMDDYMEQAITEQEIDDEVYDMEYINEDFYNGNTDGVGAPEEEYEDYDDFQ